MRVRFIVNPKAGVERLQAKLGSLLYYLFDDGHDVSMRFTRGKDDATAYAEEADADGVDRIVAVGGDGTVNEVITGMMRRASEIPLYILPDGTVNDFATYMGLRRTVWDAYRAITGDSIRSVDCGKCGDRYFLNVGAMGIFTDVAYTTSVGLKTAFGRVAYVFQALKTLRPERLRPMDLAIESKEFSGDVRAGLLLIANTSSVGGFDKMAPLASVEDGKLDVLVFRDMPVSEMITAFFRVREGEHIRHPSVLYFKTSRMHIESPQTVEVDIDGEYYGTLPVTFEVVPSAISLLV